ncbi:hypothetical protein EAE96_002901 [Botrytis aclada]|nr:hypothetical protein EAE96_002901 [Botrytis aclada]
MHRDMQINAQSAVAVNPHITNVGNNHMIQQSRVLRMGQTTGINTDNMSEFNAGNSNSANKRFLNNNPSLSNLNIDGKQFITEKVSVKEFTSLEMAIKNPLPCWNHPVAANGQLYQRVKSPILFGYFNQFGFSDENLLDQMAKSLEQMSIPITFPILAGVPKWVYDYCFLNGQVCYASTHAAARNLLPLLPCIVPSEALLPLVPCTHYKSHDSDRQSAAFGPQEMKMKSTSFDEGQISSSSSPLGLDSPQFSRAPGVTLASLSLEGQRLMVEARQKALASKILITGRDSSKEEKNVDDSRVHTMETHTTADHSTYVDATRREITGIVDRAKERANERDRARFLLAHGSMTNNASGYTSCETIFQEKLNALKMKDQGRQEQYASLMERKAYLETLRQTRQTQHDAEQKKSDEDRREEEYQRRHCDAPSFDRREFRDYKYLTFSELNEVREARDEFQASIADAQLAYFAAQRAKEAAYMQLKAVVAERKAFCMDNIYRLNNPRIKKEISDADKKFVERQDEYNMRFNAFRAIRDAIQQKHKDREAFEKRIEAINRGRGDDIYRKTESAKNNSTCATLTEDYYSLRATLARLDAHAIAMRDKPKLQPPCMVEASWSDGNYDSFGQRKHNQKQRNPSISSNDYITVEEHTQRPIYDYDQSAVRAFISRPNKVPAHHGPRPFETNISSQIPTTTGQYPNPGSRNYYSVKITDSAEYMTMFKEQKPQANHSDIMKSMIIGRAARGRQLADEQPAQFDDAWLQDISRFNNLREDAPAETADSMALASSALDLSAVKEQSQCAAEVADKKVAVFNNANEMLTETCKTTDATTSTMNEQDIMADEIVSDIIDITKKLADINIATANQIVTIADEAVVEATKSDDIPTAQQVVNSEANSISESTANVEMTNIENLALNEPLNSNTGGTEIISEDMMQESLLLDFTSAPPFTPVAAPSYTRKFDLEYDSDVQSERSWVMTSDNESAEESEVVEDWEML